MNEALAGPLQFRRERSRPFDPAEELARLRDVQSIVRIVLPNGEPAWLISRYADVRNALSETRFSNAQTRPVLLRPHLKDFPQHQPGYFLRYDPPDHTRLRRLFTGAFTVKRMASMRPRIRTIMAEHLEAMEQTGPPVDLLPAFALPIPSIVIWELFGIPDVDWREFQQITGVLADLTLSEQQLTKVFSERHAFLADVVRRQRSHPGDGILGTLIREHGTEVSDAELIGAIHLVLNAARTERWRACSHSVFFCYCSIPTRWKHFDRPRSPPS